MNISAKRFRNIFPQSNIAKKISIVGVIVLGIAIPLTMRFLFHPTNTKSKAFAGTSLSLVDNNQQFNPTYAVGDTIPLDIQLDPGGNLVSLAKIAISYDSSKITPVGAGIVPDSTIFPVTVEGPVRGPCSGTMCTLIITLAIGADPTKAIAQQVKIGKVTFQAIAATGNTTTQIGFDQASLAFSIGTSDQARENVLQGGNPLDITITSSSSLTPSTDLSPSPTDSFPSDTPFPSDSPFPSDTPVPSDTPIPGDTVFSFNIFLHGLGNSGDNTNPNGKGNMNPLHPQRNFYVDVYDANNNLFTSQQGTVNYNSNTGSFQGTIDMGGFVPTDNYLIKIHADGYLVRLVGEGFYHVAQGVTNTIPATTLITGDINNDNQLDIQDYNALISCYGTNMNSGTCWDPTASDLNDNGSVGGEDYNLFLRELTVHNGD